MPEHLLEDVLAGGAAGRAACDHALQPLQARPRVVFNRLPGDQRRAEPLDHGLRVGQALPELGRLGVLGRAPTLEPVAQLSHVRGVEIGPPDEVPDQRRHRTGRGQHTYQ